MTPERIKKITEEVIAEIAHRIGYQPRFVDVQPQGMRQKRGVSLTWVIPLSFRAPEATRRMEEAHIEIQVAHDSTDESIKEEISQKLVAQLSYHLGLGEKLLRSS